MPDFANLTVFITASFLITIAPGPDILFLISQTLNHGPKAGIPTALGLTLGNLIHTLAAALGISVIFYSSELAFNLIKILGIGYLLYLAYEVMTTKMSHKPESFDLSTRSLVSRGILMNLLNPKVMLFFIAFLPQFANPNAPHVWLEMIMLGVIFTIIVLITFGSIGLLASHIVKLMPYKSLTGTSYKWVLAAVYIFIATRLIF